MFIVMFNRLGCFYTESQVTNEDCQKGDTTASFDISE